MLQGAFYVFASCRKVPVVSRCRVRKAASYRDGSRGDSLWTVANREGASSVCLWSTHKLWLLLVPTHSLCLPVSVSLVSICPSALKGPKRLTGRYKLIRFIYLSAFDCLHSSVCMSGWLASWLVCLLAGRLVGLPENKRTQIRVRFCSLFSS